MASITIKFNLMEETDKHALYRLLSSNPDKKIWKKGIYRIDDDEIHLPAWLIKRQSRKHHDQCYEVMDTFHFAKGGFSTLHDSFFNMRLKNTEIEINPKSYQKQRALKSIKITEDLPLTMIEAEAKIMQGISYLHAKELVSEGEQCFIIMKKLPVLTLGQIIKRRKTLSFQQRNNLSIALTRALKDFHDKGLMHLDVKPDNFLIQQVGDEFIVFLIDFTFSAEKTEVVTSNIGTPPYAAYECYTSEPKTYKTDIRALGRVLMLVWGEEFSTENPGFTSYDFLGYSLKPNYNYLFKWLPMLPTFHENLTVLFKKMCATDQPDRPELTMVLDELDRFNERCDHPGIPHIQINKPRQEKKITMPQLIVDSVEEFTTNGNTI